MTEDDTRKLPPIPQSLIQKLRGIEPQKIAEEIVSVQPMPDIDWEALARSPLWRSFVRRHFGKNND